MSQSDRSGILTLVTRAEAAESEVRRLQFQLSSLSARLDATQQEREDAQNQCADHQRGENAALNELSAVRTALRALEAEMRHKLDHPLAFPRIDRLYVEEWADTLSRLSQEPENA